MSIDEMTDLDFCDILKQCVERLERERNYVTLIETPYTNTLIIIDEDDEVNDQTDKKFGYIDFKLVIKPTKKIKL